MAKAYIGCSGFSYNHWRGLFYPTSLKSTEWFNYYQRFFSTVEMNVTFYRLPRREQFKKWYTESIKEFRFAIKGSRYITHIKRLNIERSSLEKFFSNLSPLKDKLAVILWQFPPNFPKNTNRLSSFIRMIKTLLPYHKYRHTFEFRHQSWICNEIERLLADNNFCFCMADWPEFNKQLPVTSDFVYIRRHGTGGSYSSCYTEEQLRKDAELIKGFLKQGLDIFIYFNNDYNAYAPQNALTLKKFLEQI